MRRVCYFVYNINDPHVHRRIAVLRAAGAKVELVGFSRSDDPTPAGVPVIDIGRTKNGALGARVLAVLKAMARPAAYRAALLDADVVFARNLEMLAIAVSVLRGVRKRPRLVYESLDVHRALSGTGAKNRALRALERWLMLRCDLLITSSPRFVTEHFERTGPLPIPFEVVENKVFALKRAPQEQRTTTDAPPWIISWFGLLRCHKSLAMLTEIARRGGDRIEVLIAGKPSYNEMPDFDAIVAETPNVRFLGGYVAADMPALYGRAHFCWCIDYLEEGQNSSWLLPNRIYEGSVFGAIPIALETVETGAWLRRKGIGVLVKNPVDDVVRKIAGMGPEEYRRLLGDVRALPRERLIATLDDGVALLRSLTGDPHAGPDARRVPA